jgi:hypothetical protein
MRYDIICAIHRHALILEPLLEIPAATDLFGPQITWQRVIRNVRYDRGRPYATAA